MCYTKEETKFIEFLEYYRQFYKKAHMIAENKHGETILPKGKGRNEFEMYALDDICHSCETFSENGLRFTPKTTDAIWYKKENGMFLIFLIEFKGDYLCKNSSKCRLVDVLDTLKIKNNEYNYIFNHEINSLDKIVDKYSDNMLNGLAAKPLETVTVSLPLIYEEYYEKNKDKVDYLDIRSFLHNSRIVYRVVSISEDYEPNRQKSRGRSYRCSTMIPAECKKLAKEKRDRELDSSYESSLQTYHKRYEKAGIVYSAGFVDNTSFNKFINDNLILVLEHRQVLHLCL